VEQLKSEITGLSERLASLETSLARKHGTQCNYDKTIAETEGAYNKIMQSSVTLLGVLKREAKVLESEHQLI